MNFNRTERSFTTVPWVCVHLLLISLMYEICPQQNKALSSDQALKEIHWPRNILMLWVINMYTVKV